MSPGWIASAVAAAVAMATYLVPALLIETKLLSGAGKAVWYVIPLVIGVLAGLIVYRWARKRDRALAATIDRIEALDSHDERLPDNDLGETGRLTTVVNALLGRMEHAEVREREFLASASHEIRRPLAALRAELELAVRHPQGARELRRAISRALTDVEAMSRLTDDLLFQARHQAGALVPDDDLIDVTEWIYGAVDNSQRAVPDMPDIFVGDIPALEIRGDEDGLMRVLENLIVNAGKHAGANARIVIEAERLTPDQALVVHVTDDGPGVPTDEQKTIFEAFARGDRARAVGGSGLGLAIARSWIRAHQGDLSLISPVPAPPVPASPVPASPVPASPVPASPDSVSPERPGARFTIRLPSDRIVDSAV